MIGHSMLESDIIAADLNGVPSPQPERSSRLDPRSDLRAAEVRVTRELARRTPSKRLRTLADKGVTNNTVKQKQQD